MKNKPEIPREYPLARGEFLGCTSSVIENPETVSWVLFIADGRFHLESLLISYPELKVLRYDPFLGAIQEERLNGSELYSQRKIAIRKFKQSQKRLGIFISTLGRQGNIEIVNRITGSIKKCCKYQLIAAPELSPELVNIWYEEFDAIMQVGCPRLSLDWNSSYSIPLLTPYELLVAIGSTIWKKSNIII